MGKNSGMIIAMVVGVAAGFGAPMLAGMSSTGATALAGQTAIAAGGLATGAQTAAMATTIGGLATGGFSMGSMMAAGMMAITMMQPEIQAPDYSNMFAQQQQGLTQQQSFGRKATGELEQMLEFGSDYEKNQAYD